MIVYVFLMQRPHDRQPWPAAWTNLELAMKEPFRVSGVRAVDVRPLPKVPAANDDKGK